MASKFVSIAAGAHELYVPTLRDRFEIVPGGMPNGDPSLRIGLGSTDGYTARIADTAAASSPFYSTGNGTGTVRAFGFWIKPHPTIKFETANATHGYPTSCLFAVMTGSAGAPTLSDFNSPSNNVKQMIGAAPDATGETLTLRMMENLESNTPPYTAGNGARANVTLTAGAWNFIVCQRQITTSARPRWAFWKNGVPSGDSSITTYNVGASISDDAGRVFSMGPIESAAGGLYPPLRLAGGSTAGFEIGKLTIWNASLPLTDAQILALYDSMMSG